MCPILHTQQEHLGLMIHHSLDTNNQVCQLGFTPGMSLSIAMHWQRRTYDAVCSNIGRRFRVPRNQKYVMHRGSASGLRQPVNTITEMVHFKDDCSRDMHLRHGRSEISLPGLVGMVSILFRQVFFAPFNESPAVSSKMSVSICNISKV